MGNDGSDDRLRSRFGLSGKYFKSWHKHLVVKTLEDGIINASANYLLDTNCKVETFPVFMIMLVDELLESGKNLRSRKAKLITEGNTCEDQNGQFQAAMKR